MLPSMAITVKALIGIRLMDHMALELVFGLSVALQVTMVWEQEYLILTNGLDITMHALPTVALIWL